MATLSRDHHGPRAVLNALERLADGYGSECDRVQRDLGIAQSQLRDYQARLGKPFPHDAYLAELTTLRDQLKAKLSATGHDAGTGVGPSADELAERVKALKSANSVEATTQRTAPQPITAEEPITRRIRWRALSGEDAEAAVMTDRHAAHEDTSASTATDGQAADGQVNADALSWKPAAMAKDSPVNPTTFRERIALERRGNGLEPSLS